MSKAAACKHGIEAFRWEHLLSCPTSPTDPSSHALAIKQPNLVHLQVRCHHIPHEAFHKKKKKILQHCPAKNHTWRFSTKAHCFHGTDALWTSAPKYHRIFITKQRLSRMAPHRKMYSYIITCHSYQHKVPLYTRMGLFVGWVKRCILGEWCYVGTLDEIFPQQNSTLYNSTALLLWDSAPCETAQCQLYVHVCIYI